MDWTMTKSNRNISLSIWCVGSYFICVCQKLYRKIQYSQCGRLKVLVNVIRRVYRGSSNHYHFLHHHSFYFYFMSLYLSLLHLFLALVSPFASVVSRFSHSLSLSCLSPSYSLLFVSCTRLVIFSRFLFRSSLSLLLFRFKPTTTRSCLATFKFQTAHRETLWGIWGMLDWYFQTITLTE